MPKVTLSDVTNLGGNPVSAQQVINTNSDRIEAAIEKTLSRDGTSPNQMEADFDMNHYDVLNAGTVYGDKFVIDGIEFEGTALWIISSGAPGGSVGKLGDIYLDSITGDVYGPKTSFGWGSVSANIKGPQGIQGPQGVQGIQGVQGLQGMQGPQGLQGPQGVQGVQGEKGDSFSPDAIGLTSDRVNYDDEPKGFSFLDSQTGYLYFKLSATSGDWSPGITFTTGPQGPVGPQGVQGPEGPQGVEGPQGIQGPAGVGVPVGGTVGQILVKNSSADYDTSWDTIEFPLVTDTMVATPATPSDGINSNKIKLDLTDDNPDFVVRLVSDKFRDVVSARDFGAFGVNNDYTTELQNFLDEVKPTGSVAWIPQGEYSISSGLVLNNQGTNVPPGVNPDKNEILYRTAIVGDGAGSTIIRALGDFTALHIQTGMGRAHHRGFSIVQDDNTNYIGIGLLVDQSMSLKFTDIELKGFQYGCHHTDTFSVSYNDVDFHDNNTGFLGDLTLASHPNAINFNSCRWTGNKSIGAYLINPTTCNFNGGSFESNGSGTSSDSGIAIQGNSNEGAFGCNIEGVYFEKNFGLADIVINNVGSGDRVGMHRIKGCTFNRIDNVQFTDHNIYIGKNSSGFLKVVASENSFQGFGTYVPDIARKYILLADGGGGLPLLSSADNLYGSATEAP